MSRVCEICGKGRLIGNHIETRGKAKYLGGVGTKITGITRRSFLPNLQNVRTTTENGITKTLRVCTQCIRSGAIRKQVRNAPFKLAHELEAAAAGKRIGVKRNKKTTTKTNNNNNNNNNNKTSKNTTKK